jgi:hypothetical protein
MERDPLERWKVDGGDRKQSRRYDRWKEAVEEMLEQTDTKSCPWTVVSAADERWCRVKVFETLVGRMSDALARRRKAPARISRTRLAADATRTQRAQRAQEAFSRAQKTAREAGLPLEGEK